MLNESNFVIRVSGRKEKSYYIDYSGEYKVLEVAKITGLNPVEVKAKYTENGAVYDDELDIYYFPSMESAKKIIDELIKNLQPQHRGKPIFLTDAEIEYIRMALINEGSNTIHVSNNVKDAIFKKLNQ